MNGESSPPLSAKDSGIQSISRASAVLDAVAECSRTGARLNDVTKATELNRATVHRILNALVRTGLLERAEQEPLYFVGIRVMALAAASARRFGLAERYAGACARIAARSGDTVFLQALSGRESVCLSRTEGSFPIKALTLEVGERRPLGIGAGGLAILASLDEAERQSVLNADAGRHHDFNITRAQIEDGVHRTHTDGYALDANTVIQGITGVSVPLDGRTPGAIGALTVAAISDRLQGAHLASVIEDLGNEVARIGLEPPAFDLPAPSSRCADATRGR